MYSQNLAEQKESRRNQGVIGKPGTASDTQFRYTDSIYIYIYIYIYYYVYYVIIYLYIYHHLSLSGG